VLMSVNDRVVLIVGASSGIGRVSAVLFAREGARVMAAARRGQKLRHLHEELAQNGHQIEVYECDASSASDMEQLARQTSTKLGQIDILVYTAGINVRNRAMKDLNVETWDMLLSVNLSGAYYITQAVLPQMRQARSGHLIYVSSISGLLPDVSGAAYQAAKRGLLGFAHATRLEEKGNGIRTCVVCPGLVDTELVEQRPVRPTREILQNALQAEDIAEMILFIAKLPPRVAIPEMQILPSVL